MRNTGGAPPWEPIQDAMASYSFFFLAHANLKARTGFFAIESHPTADAAISAQTTTRSGF